MSGAESIDTPTTCAPLVLQRIANGDGAPQWAWPGRERQMIGAWCFLEHVGPRGADDEGAARIGRHPHAGLQTFTWMIDGELRHRDSLGTKQLIRTGQINLLTAGRGVAHAEESPAEHSPRTLAAHLWIALPNAMGHCEPSFVHYPELPKLAAGVFNLTLMVGQLFGAESPVQVHSPLIGVELITNGAARTTMPLRGDFEYGVLVLQGEAVVAGERLVPGELLYIGENHTRFEVCCDAPASLLMLGGKRMHEHPMPWYTTGTRCVTGLFSAPARDGPPCRRYPPVCRGRTARRGTSCSRPVRRTSAARRPRSAIPGR
jgi:redox-sensitive bicupin YhaK (pirin superfamily)